MKTAFRSSFTRDLKKIKDQSVLKDVKQVIEELEEAVSLHAFTKLEKISSSRNFYRIRIGDYRIGIAVEAEEVVFVRCLHRRDIYRFFP